NFLGPGMSERVFPIARRRSEAILWNRSLSDCNAASGKRRRSGGTVFAEWGTKYRLPHGVRFGLVIQTLVGRAAGRGVAAGLRSICLVKAAGPPELRRRHSPSPERTRRRTRCLDVSNLSSS